MSQNSLAMGFVYNPENQNEEELRDRFVIRTKEFERIIRDLKRTATTTLAQQYLIEGQRGTGKTSLLLRIQSEVLSEKSLAHLLPVRFAEEQYGIFNLYGLWEKVAEELEETEGFESLLETLEEQSEEADYELQCFDTLEHYLIKNNKKLLLLMDNFGDVLDKFSLTEQQRLRDIFHNSAYIQLIAATAKTLEHTYKHDSPFFEFFNIIHLSGLDKQDTYTLLRKLAEVHGVEQQIEHILEHQQHRVESIRRLTGGVPRTIVLLYEIFVDESGGVFEDLENILDRVTPLYKHRMDDLSTQQQVLVNALALNWDGMSTKELTDKIKDKKFASKNISAQLQQLISNDLVVAKALDKKNKIYFLQERFFNIWYLMRYGRKRNKQNVRWLVSFLREWCDTSELHKRAKRHIEAAREGRLHPKGYLMAESMGYLITDEDLQHELIKETRDALKFQIGDIYEKLSLSDKEIWEQADEAYKEKNYHVAKILCQALTRKGSARGMYNLGYLYYSEYKDFDQAIKYYEMAVKQGAVQAMHNLAYLYESEYKDFDQAIKYYKMAVDKADARAMFNLGALYKSEYKDFDQAIKYYGMAAKQGDTDAMNSLAHLYKSEYKDFDQAIKYHEMALELGDADAMFFLGNLYESEYKDYGQAIKYYKMAIELGDASAMYNLGYLYSEKYKDYGQAIKYYEMAIELGDVDAMTNLGCLYELEYKDYDQAIKYYEMAIEQGDVDAMINLGCLYLSEYRDFDQAIKYFETAVEKGDADAMNELAWLYYTQCHEPILSLELSKKAGEIVKAPHCLHTLATALLWNNELQESFIKIKEYLSYTEHYIEHLDDVSDYFILLLAKEQAEAALQLFKETPNLEQQIKPVYYATLTILKDQYPKEYLKMGSELKETVDEILEKVKEKAERYG